MSIGKSPCVVYGNMLALRKLGMPQLQESPPSASRLRINWGPVRPNFSFFKHRNKQTNTYVHIMLLIHKYVSTCIAVYIKKLVQTIYIHMNMCKHIYVYTHISV